MRRALCITEPKVTNERPFRESDAVLSVSPRFPIPMIPSVSVVIPALNERENLTYVIPRIPHWVDEVVLVDGKSTDGTVQAACDLWPNNHIVQVERRQLGKINSLIERDKRSRGITLRLLTQTGEGKGAALRTGFAAATGDIIITLDADGSNNPAEIPAFAGALLAGADFAKGSRFLEGGGTTDMPLYRKLGNWGLTMTVRILFGTRYSDLCYGFNAFWADVLPSLKLYGDGFEIETLISVRAKKANLRITEVASFESKRLYGSGRLRTIPDGWRVLKTILKERFDLAQFDISGRKPYELATKNIYRNSMWQVSPSFSNTSNQIESVSE